MKSRSWSEKVNGSWQGTSWQIFVWSFISPEALVFEKQSWTQRLNPSLLRNITWPVSANSAKGAVLKGSIFLKIKHFLFKKGLVNCYMSQRTTKPTKWHVPPAKTRISLASTQSDQCSLCAQWVAKDPSFLCAEAKALLLQTVKIQIMCTQQRHRSDWVDAQADLSLCWVHMSFCRFCHALAHMVLIQS